MIEEVRGDREPPPDAAVSFIGLPVYFFPLLLKVLICALSCLLREEQGREPSFESLRSMVLSSINFLEVDV